MIVDNSVLLPTTVTVVVQSVWIFWTGVFKSFCISRFYRRFDTGCFTWSIKEVTISFFLFPSQGFHCMFPLFLTTGFSLMPSDNAGNRVMIWPVVWESGSSHLSQSSAMMRLVKNTWKGTILASADVVIQCCISQSGKDIAFIIKLIMNTSTDVCGQGDKLTEFFLLEKVAKVIFLGGADVHVSHN